MSGLTLAQFLKAQLKKVQKKNPRFSLRSFARKAGISPGAMADLTQGKRALSEFYASKIADGLNFSGEEREVLFSFVATKSRKFIIDKTLTEEQMSLITQWHHYAILNLMKTKDFQSSPEWIAERLGLRTLVVEESLALLLRLGLIAWSKNSYKRVFHNLLTTVDIPSKALVAAHKNHLLKAIEVLERTQPSARSFTSITMPVDVRKLEEAKKQIRNFRQRMSLLLEGEPREVYTLSIQLYPLTPLREAPKGDKT